MGLGLGRGQNGVQSRGPACCPSQVMFRILQESMAFITELWLRCRQAMACLQGGAEEGAAPCGCSRSLLSSVPGVNWLIF